MSIYAVTTSNWDDPAFWSGISESATGHKIDFSALPSNFTVNVDTNSGTASVNDGVTSFLVGDANYGGAADAMLGGATQWGFFTEFKGSDGDDAIVGGAGDDTIRAGEGSDSIQGGTGDDVISLGMTQDLSATDGGDDTLVLVDGFGNDSIDGFEVPTDLGGGHLVARDQVDVTGLTDAGGSPINTDDVSLSDTNGDGTGDAILTFPGGETLTLRDVSVSQVSSPAQLEAIGIPSAAASALNYIVEGTAAGEVINVGYGGDPDGDQIDNNDHIDGSNDDSVQAGGGDDTVDAALGNDTVDAGDGDDIVYAEAGDDSVIGGLGDDTLLGAGGSDTLLGGTGADSLEGGDNEDVLLGGTGNDSLWGQEDNDTLVGGVGDDFLNGGYGDDLVQGGAGNDFLEGWYGDDTIEGGAGNDFIDADIDSDLVYGGDGDDTVLGGFSVSTDTIYGGAGNDSLDGQSGDDLLYGGTGDDVLIGNYGDDTIFLEDGFGNDTIIGTDGDETDGDTLDLSKVTTATTVDLSDANTGTGTVSDGTDTASFIEIENIVLGGGRDTVVLADGSGADAVSAFDMTDSGDGTTRDQLDVSDLTSDGGTTPVTTADVTVTDTNGDGTGDAILSFPYAESITLVGVLPSQVDSAAELEAIGIPAAGAGPDYIVEGTAGADLIDAAYAGDPEGDMVDNLDHSDGSNNDSIEAYGGDDSVIAGVGDDTVQAGSGADTVIGGDGDDSIFGGSDADVLAGNEGADTLYGEDGDDLLFGGAGDDSLVGGAGNDVFVYGAGGGNDKISDFNAGNTGTLNDGDATNNDFVDLSGHYDHISELYADQADDGILNQSNAYDTRGNATDYSDNTEFGAGSLTLDGVSADRSGLTVENTGVVCFTSGTAIRTPDGDVLIDDLKVGDYVTTLDNGPQEIRWIGHRHVDNAEFRSAPTLRPILIKRGVLGAERDLFVSRQHGMLVGRDHLVRAAHLATTLPGVRIAHGQQSVTYVHLLFDAHQIIIAENTKSESFYPGRVALQMMSKAARDELFTLFPELATIHPNSFSAQPYGETARQLLNGKMLQQAQGSSRRMLARIMGKSV